MADPSGVGQERQRDVESLDDFLSRLVEVAEDWRYSDEFIGILVRSRWPRDYDKASRG